MRGEKFMKVVILTLCIVVASYLIFSVTTYSENSFTTYKAVRYEVGDGITTSGFVVRSEVPVEDRSGDIVVLTRTEGERVGKGQNVASTFKDSAARQRQARIEALEKELSQMEYAYSYSASDSDSATLDSDIQRLINQITVYTARREFSFADGASEQLKPYILRRFLTRDDAETLWSRISDTRSILNTLYAEAKSESGSIKAQTAGYFSSVTDGLEGELTPDFLMNATVSQLQAFESRPAADTGAVGKLVTSIKWYYACVVETDSLRNLREGDRVDVNFAYDFTDTIRMKVERISPSEGELCILVLSSDQYIQNAVTARKQSADLIFDTKSGLRVPKTGIYVVDGESGVYVLEGAEARWKPVTILYDNGESFVVALDKSTTKNLWPEDEIILTKEELFEGKVMIK